MDSQKKPWEPEVSNAYKHVRPHFFQIFILIPAWKYILQDKYWQKYKETLIDKSLFLLYDI